MQRSTVLFLLLGCAVAAVVATIALSGSGEVVLPPNDHENGSVGSLPSQTGSQDPAGSQPSRVLPVPPDAPHVTITVTSKERFVPPPMSAPMSAPLALTADGQPLPVQILSGVGSGFDAVASHRGVAMVAVEGSSGRLLRQIVSGQEAPNPTRIGPRIVVRGTVLDVARQPVPAAFVWFGELGADGSPREFGVDEEGAFAADVPAGVGVPMVVRATGFASKWRTIQVASDMRPLAEVLQPAATVRIQLAARAIEMDKARAFLVTSGQVSSEVSQWPFFRQCVSGGYEINAQGQVRIDDLPQAGVVGVVIRHPLAPLMAPAEIKLGPKLVLATVPLRMGESRMLGIVADDEGHGIAAASVWSMRKGQRLDGARSQRLLPPHLDLRGTCYAQTDSQGQFVIASSDEVEPILSVRAHGYAGRNVPMKRSGEAQIVLPKWRGGEAALRILPPVPGKVWRVSINLGGGIEEACTADQPFVVALPHVGSFDLEMMLRIDGERRGARDVKALMVTGPVDLVTPTPN